MSGMVSRPMMPPTAGETLRISELRTEVDAAQVRLDGILQGRVAAINRDLATVPHVIVRQTTPVLIP